MTPTPQQPQPIEATPLLKPKEELSKQKFYSRDFSGMDFSHAKMRHSLFYQCNFNRSNMSMADCEGSEFTNSTFIDTICYRTNFKDAKLANTQFAPKECFGMTITLQCKTFENMKVSQIWWYAFLFFATLMRPTNSPIKEPLLDNLIAMIGNNRWVKLNAMFGKRDF
jgi:uncharacterized protein YjbI with pentapeptide repeats